MLKFSSRDWYSEPPSAPNSEDYQSRTWIDTISVYDAAEVAAIHTERPDLSGDHHLNDGSALQFAISEKPRVNWCISIKIGVHVSFGRALPRTEDAEYGEITFGAVGVNFIDQLSTVQTEPGAVPIRL